MPFDKSKNKRRRGMGELDSKYLDLYYVPDKKRVCLSASATVEGALVIPVFIYAVMSIMYVISMISVQVHIEEALYNEARKLSKYTYASEDIFVDEDISADEKNILKNGFLDTTAKALLIREIGADYANNNHIIGGNLGLVMTGSVLDENIELQVSYAVKNPFDIFGLGVKKYTQKAVVHAWKGVEGNLGVKALFDENRENSVKDEDLFVYITKYASVYHADIKCTYLSPGIVSTDKKNIETLRNKSGGKYYACEYCGYKKSDQIYVTEFGNRYHASPECKTIFHDILTVKKSSVTGLKQCSKCGV